MKNNFLTCTLFDIALKDKGSIISGPFGSDISSRFFQESGVPVIRGNNLSNGYKKFIDGGFVFVSEDKADDLDAYAIKNDLIFTAAGTIGQVGLIEQKTKYPKYVISNKQLRVRLDTNKINPLYAYYWFSSPWIVKDIINKNTGSTVPLINLGIIKSLRIDIPKERTLQDKIASILSALDSKIEINNCVNAELEQMAKTLYDYWFVQFDFPDKDGKPYKTSGGKMVWSEELKREIPEGWSGATLLNNPFTNIIKPGIEKFDGTKEYLATADINDQEIGIGNNITFNNRESRANMQPTQNSVWFAKMKASKKHLFIGKHSEDIIDKNILSTGFMGLKCKDFAFEFIASLIASDNFETIKDTISHGATMQGIGNDDLKFIRIIVPNEKILVDYKKLVEFMYAKMEIHRRESRKLAELRDWLLPMLMNGQVKIKGKFLKR